MVAQRRRLDHPHVVERPAAAVELGIAPERGQLGCPGAKVVACAGDVDPAGELTAFWRDPEFDRTRGAFYYVRVIQAPTLRHHVYDAIALGIDPTTLDFPATIQERAWSSPVWYRP